MSDRLPFDGDPRYYHGLEKFVESLEPVAHEFLTGAEGDVEILSGDDYDYQTDVKWYDAISGHVSPAVLEKIYAQATGKRLVEGKWR